MKQSDLPRVAVPLRGPGSLTRRDRGWFYQNFTLALLESKNCIGWHWFRYLDNDPEVTP